MSAVPASPTTTADWAAIYAEHGRAMRSAANAAMGGPLKEILGKTADNVVGDVVRQSKDRRICRVASLS